MELSLPLEVPGSTSGGTFDVFSGAALIGYTYGTSWCLADNGSVTVDPYGDVGTTVAGTVTVYSWGLAGCPATTWTVSFSATREADGY